MPRTELAAVGRVLGVGHGRRTFPGEWTRDAFLALACSAFYLDPLTPDFKRSVLYPLPKCPCIPNFLWNCIF